MAIKRIGVDMFFIEWVYTALFGKDAADDLKSSPRRKRR
jgi:hypothetical protein